MLAWALAALARTAATSTAVIFFMAISIKIVAMRRL
jgi:hypothetical protein